VVPSSPDLMAGVSGIRGIIGRGMTPEVAARYALAYAGLIPAGPIVLARDPRASGPELRAAVVAALSGAGREIIDLDVVPTPTLLMHAELLAAAGGIMITASHNPVAWNGLKFADRAGRYLAPADSAELIRRVAEGGDAAPETAGAAASPAPALRFDSQSAARHGGRVSAARGVDLAAVARAGLTVAVDGCGGAAALTLPAFLEEHGVAVHRIHCQPDGTFPRPPEPVPEALTDLSREVVATGAQLGFALDPDGDRLAVVGPDGTPLGEEMTLVLAARTVLAHEPGPVVVNLSTSRMIDDVARATGAEVHRTPVGEINVVEGMLATGAMIGGEGNGGVIHAGVVLGRDALIGAALILTALAAAGGDPGRLLAGINRYAFLKLRYALPPGGREELAERLAFLPDTLPGARTDTRDGFRLEWEDRWIHVRASNTEPIVRLLVEAPTESEARRLAEETAGRCELRHE